MTDAPGPRILARIHPPQAKRWFAIACVAALGGVLIWVAVAEPPEHAWAIVFLLGFGALSLWLAERMRQATAGRLTLTEAGLEDADGRLIAPIGRIVSVSRGAFAFKPSNGFVLTMDRGDGFAWQPGLWWRIGRRIGVGGVILGTEGKFMAEMVDVLLSERRAADR